MEIVIVVYLGGNGVELYGGVGRKFMVVIGG